MKVYIDLILLINFLYDILILFSTSILLKRHIKFYRIILSGLIGEISVLNLFISMSSFILLFFKIIISVFMILICFGKKSFFTNLFYFYIITVVIGGSEYLVSGNKYEVNILFLLILAPFIVYLYIMFVKDYNLRISMEYDVIIIDKTNTYKLRGYLDTGNNLVDPITKYPVIMIRDDIKFKTNKYFYVPYKVINDSSILKCVMVDKVIINNKIVDCLLGIVDKSIFNNEDVILNNNLKEIFI